MHEPYGGRRTRLGFILAASLVGSESKLHRRNMHKLSSLLLLSRLCLILLFHKRLKNSYTSIWGGKEGRPYVSPARDRRRSRFSRRPIGPPSADKPSGLLKFFFIFFVPFLFYFFYFTCIYNVVNISIQK